MRGIAKIIGTLLVGILSAALAVIFQNDIAAFFGRAPITAEITIGAWYPYFDSSNTREPYSQADSAAAERYADSEKINFARIWISNRSGEAVPHIYLSADSGRSSDWISFSTVTIRTSEGRLVREMHPPSGRRVDLGSLDAASSMTVYVWSNRTFGYPFDMSDISLVASGAQISTTVNRFSGDATSFLFGIHVETIAWWLLGITIVLAIILIAVLSWQWKFIKALLRSDDYYLEQRQRYDPDPAKFTIPDKIP